MHYYLVALFRAICGNALSVNFYNKKKGKKTNMSKKILTRTIKTNMVTVLCLNTVTSEPYNETFYLDPSIKTHEKMLNALRKKYDTDDNKVVAVVSVKTVEKKYAISEEDFIANAKEILPKETA